MSENKENKKNKNLNEKEIEKVSGGQKIGGPPIIKPKEKNSNPNEIKNLQPFSDEDKDKN